MSHDFKILQLPHVDSHEYAKKAQLHSPNPKKNPSSYAQPSNKSPYIPQYNPDKTLAQVVYGYNPSEYYPWSCQEAKAMGPFGIIGFVGALSTGNPYTPTPPQLAPKGARIGKVLEEPLPLADHKTKSRTGRNLLQTYAATGPQVLSLRVQVPKYKVPTQNHSYYS